MPFIGANLGESSALREKGAVIALRIYPPKIVRDRLAADRKPAPFETPQALIDTGASRTCIDRSIAEKLNLTPHDQVRVFTPSGGELQFLYRVGLSLHSQRGGDLSVLGANLAAQPYHALIGRDILAFGTLIYSGWRGDFEFSF